MYRACSETRRHIVSELVDRLNRKCRAVNQAAAKYLFTSADRTWQACCGETADAYATSRFSEHDPEFQLCGDGRGGAVSHLAVYLAARNRGVRRTLGNRRTRRRNAAEFRTDLSIRAAPGIAGPHAGRRVARLFGDVHALELHGRLRPRRTDDYLRMPQRRLRSFRPEYQWPASPSVGVLQR